ncbi:hypothetical protein APSETT445_001166 [Aspergillus pseudonomiae]
MCLIMTDPKPNDPIDLGVSEDEEELKGEEKTATNVAGKPLSRRYGRPQRAQLPPSDDTTQELVPGSIQKKRGRPPKESD